MSIKKALLDFLASLPDDANQTVKPSLEQTPSEKPSPENPSSEKPSPENPPSEKPSTTTIKPSNVEPTEIIAPPIPNDITVINAADMANNSVDMRLAAFYTEQNKLADTIKILLGEVAALKEQLSTIETAIDIASRTSPTVDSIDTLVNMI